MITSYYYYLALGKTDKFIGDELKYFVEFLSNYGVMDYMSGLYYYFYQRDEVKAVETLENLKTFYHKSMYKMAYDEIESAKEEFPILELNAKEDTFNYPLDEILLNVTGYKEDLGELNFTDNI